MLSMIDQVLHRALAERVGSPRMTRAPISPASPRRRSPMPMPIRDRSSPPSGPVPGHALARSVAFDGRRGRCASRTCTTGPSIDEQTGQVRRLGRASRRRCRAGRRRRPSTCLPRAVPCPAGVPHRAWRWREVRIAAPGVHRSRGRRSARRIDADAVRGLAGLVDVDELGTSWQPAPRGCTLSRTRVKGTSCLPSGPAVCRRGSSRRTVVPFLTADLVDDVVEAPADHVGQS
jgi:hypothetical protein